MRSDIQSVTVSSGLAGIARGDRRLHCSAKFTQKSLIFNARQPTSSFLSHLPGYDYRSFIFQSSAVFHVDCSVDMI